MMLGDQRLDELRAERLEPGDRAGLVGLHQARVADHVGREHREHPPVELGHRHDRLSGLRGPVCGSPRGLQPAGVGPINASA